MCFDVNAQRDTVGPGRGLNQTFDVIFAPSASRQEVSDENDVQRTARRARQYSGAEPSSTQGRQPGKHNIPSQTLITSGPGFFLFFCFLFCNSPSEESAAVVHVDIF